MASFVSNGSNERPQRSEFSFVSSFVCFVNLSFASIFFRLLNPLNLLPHSTQGIYFTTRAKTNFNFYRLCPLIRHGLTPVRPTQNFSSHFFCMSAYPARAMRTTRTPPTPLVPYFTNPTIDNLPALISHFLTEQLRELKLKTSQLFRCNITPKALLAQATAIIYLKDLLT